MPNGQVQIGMYDASAPEHRQSSTCARKEIMEQRMKAYSRTKTSLNISATFVEPAEKISLHMRLVKKASGYKPFLFDYTFDACEFMRRSNHPVTKIVWNIIRIVSTVNHTCPYEGLQVVSDFHNIEVPVPLPSGEYLILLDWLFDLRPQFASNVYFTYLEEY